MPSRPLCMLAQPDDIEMNARRPAAGRPGCAGRLPDPGAAVLADWGAGGEDELALGTRASVVQRRHGQHEPAAAQTDRDDQQLVLSVHHGDHITGLMAKETNAPIFPKAQIHVPAAEYKFWTDPSVSAGAAKRIQAVFPGWKNIRQYDGEIEVLPGVRAVSTPGHTPGHASYHVSSGGQQLMVLGDVTNTRALNMKNPGWHLVFDADPNLAEANRRKMFDRLVADKVVATGYHWGMPGAGTVAKDGNGYALVPVKA